MTNIVFRLIGVVLFAFGTALVLIVMLALDRHLTGHSDLTTPAALMVAGCGVISVLCFFAGYRLMSHRPNSHGTLLTPPWWIVLCVVFSGLGLMSVVQAVSLRKSQPLLVALGFGALGFGSLMAGRGSRRRSAHSPIFPPETSLLEMQGFVPAGFQCGIELLNDNKTPMEFVVSVLQNHMGLSRPESIRIMLEIHSKGGIVLPMSSLAEANRTAEAITAAAGRGGHPLVCRAKVGAT